MSLGSASIRLWLSPLVCRARTSRPGSALSGQMRLERPLICTRRGGSLRNMHEVHLLWVNLGQNVPWAPDSETMQRIGLSLILLLINDL